MIRINFAIYIFILIFPIAAKAEKSPNDTVNNKVLVYSSQIDSLSSLWLNKQLSPGADTSFVFEDITDTLFNPECPDSVYIDRLASLPLVIEMSYNPMVRNYIHMYTNKRRDLVENMLGLSDYYFPLFEEILDSKNMPLELKYLAVIESALNPNAVSRVGATGMWQFMYYTGRMYKLEINSFVDERRDPVKSTYAAISFMQDLYDIYHDWILVIAAYNCGPGNVNKAIRRSGGKRDYWDIYYHLPRETRGYVPAFIAAIYIMNYYDKHGLTPKRNTFPILCDTIMVADKVHLEQISKVMGISLDEIRSLNPQYRRDIIPGQSKQYALRLPFEKVTCYIELEDSIMHYKDSVYFNPAAMSKAPEYNTYVPGPPKGNYTKLVYSVKSGDNLGFISCWYNVNVSDLKYWNGIYRNNIRSGQKLVVYVPKGKESKYQSINEMSFAEKQASVGKGSSVQAQTTAQQGGTTLSPGEYELYVVRRGDTLWEIAKQYPGVTDTDIMQWNGLSEASKLSVGQQLKIKKKS
jgi:membrane-bound lytic murein transglycosylase D